MRRYSVKKVLSPREKIPFWKPWGLGRWGGWTLLFLLLLLLYLLLFCLPKRPQEPVPPVPPEVPEPPRQDPEPEPEPEPEPAPVDPDNPVPHTGDVQVLLEWETRDDVDLHVFDPAGEEIYYGHRRSASGGELDIDANAGVMMTHPKENVYWPVGGAPVGRYTVKVVLFSKRGNSSIPYHVMVKYGDRVENYTGTLRSKGQTDLVCSFVLE